MQNLVNTKCLFFQPKHAQLAGIYHFQSRMNGIYKLLRILPNLK